MAIAVRSIDRCTATICRRPGRRIDTNGGGAQLGLGRGGRPHDENDYHRSRPAAATIADALGLVLSPDNTLTLDVDSDGVDAVLCECMPEMKARAVERALDDAGYFVDAIRRADGTKWIYVRPMWPVHEEKT